MIKVGGRNYFFITNKQLQKTIIKKSIVSGDSAQNISGMKKFFNSGAFCLKQKLIIFCAAFLCVFCLCPGVLNVRADNFCFKIYALGKEYRFFSPELHISDGELSLLDIDNIVNTIYLDTLTRPQNAEIFFSPDTQNKFTFKSEKSGVCIDENLLKKQIEYALSVGSHAVKAKSCVLSPQITVQNLKAQTFLRSSFSTFYGYSSAGRKHNIALAAKSLSGTVLRQDEVFSFNRKVGLRTEENGYKPAPVILNGEFTEGVGGGVCQVSTTLYNAALKAGLEIIESHRHSLAVGYVSPSFDAMVSDNACDLRFKNVSGENVYLQATCDGQTLTISFYGIERTREYKLVSVVNEVIKADEKHVSKNSGLKPVTKKDGLKSSGYLYVYFKGKLERVLLLREDVYKAVDGVVLE